MQLDGRQAELLGYVTVLDPGGLVQGLALDPLGCQGGGGDGGAAPKGLELGVDDLSLLVHLDLELHHVSAGRSSHQASSDMLGLGVQLPDVARVFVMINHLQKIQKKGKNKE